MKIKLIFDDWREKGKSLRNSKEYIWLSLEDFHPGSTFDGNITLDAWDEKEFREALEKGFQPVFLVNS